MFALSTVTTIAPKLRIVLVFALVFAFLPLGVFAFLASLHTQHRFPLALLTLSLNGLAAMTSNFPLSAS